LRALLSQLLTDSAKEDSQFVVLSGDHGYALFDQLRRDCERQFINVGVAEQTMVGVAAGLARQGLHPVVYGLAAFIPVRVLEQIKIDVCFSRLPIIFLGDGAGLVYSTLGVSHQCAEDLACLRPLPFIRVFSPCDPEELRACYKEASRYEGPSYIRVGKSDRAVINVSPLSSTDPHWVWQGDTPGHSKGLRTGVCLIASGSMVAPAVDAARKFDLHCLSIPRIKPFARDIDRFTEGFGRLIILEEHSRYGGLASALMDAFAEHELRLPEVRVLSLDDKFSARCGGYQYALSEHGLADAQVIERVGTLVNEYFRQIDPREIVPKSG